LSVIFHAGISGARGRMGRAVSTVLDAREDVVVAARFDRGETPDLSLCDVIIDFSTPDASVELARTCAERGGPALVIGSTGLTPEQETDIHTASEKIAIVAAAISRWASTY
jgi:4-hydroxy-tetrahydrodipicolinate reductase